MSHARLPLRLAASVAAALALAGFVSAAFGQAAPRPYRILVTNDDGFRAPGLAALVTALAPLGELTIVAPEENQSGIGQAVTLFDPIYADAVSVAGRPATALTATPASCVSLALATLMPEPPDLVVSGVNRGSNFGLNVYISGTVGAAREAAMRGIPAIAAALDDAGHPDYGPAADWTARIAAIVKAGGLPSQAFLNVNVPAGPAERIKGLRFTRQSARAGTERYDEQRTPYGRRVFWSFFVQPQGGEPGTDIEAALEGYVAVTPLVASEFDTRDFDALRARFAEAAAGHR
jgi:5'-nucleotidase